MRPLLPALALFAGCAHRPPAAAPSAPGLGMALAARMQLELDAPRIGLHGTLPATLVLHRPDEFYFDLRSPLGTTVLLIALDHHALLAALPGERRALRVADPEEVLHTASAGVIGVDDLLALLAGQAPDAAPAPVATPSGPARFELDRDARGRPSALTLRGPDGTALADLRYEGWLRAGRVRCPKRIALTVPSHELRLEARFSSWELLGAVPDVFSPPIPEGWELMEPPDLGLTPPGARPPR